MGGRGDVAWLGGGGDGCCFLFGCLIGCLIDCLVVRVAGGRMGFGVVVCLFVCSFVRWVGRVRGSE